MSTVSVALQTRTFRSLRRHHNYRLFFGGQIVSLAGSWMQNVALAWLVLSLSRSPLAIAMLLFCRLGVGVGEAVCAPVGTSWIGDLYPAAKAQ